MPSWWNSYDARCDANWQPPIDLASGITQPVGTIVVDRANPGIISGVITTRENKPLTGANVQIISRNVSVGTDAAGAFSIKPLPPGRYQVRVRAIGFTPRNDTIEVTATSGLRVRLPMEIDLNGGCAALRIAGYRAPPPAKPDSRWLWYLHGDASADQPSATVRVGAAIDQYGRVQSMLQDSGFIVTYEPRKSNVDPELYADSVVQQIRARLAAGVPAANISVLGDAKGALIAMLVSARLPDRDIRYVVLDGCSRSNLARYPLQFHGNVLSIFESSDTLSGSCAYAFRRSIDMGYKKELMLRTGLADANGRHPLAEWLGPALRWARTGGAGDSQALLEKPSAHALSVTDRPYGYLPPLPKDWHDLECDGTLQPGIDLESRITKPVGRFVADANAPGVIRGTITTRDNTPLLGANVTIGGSISEGTDSSGAFHIKRLPAGRYVIHIRAIGYLPRVDTVDVNATEGIRVRIPLRVDDNHLTDACGFGRFSLSHAKPDPGSWGHWLFFLHDEAVENITRGYLVVNFGEYEYNRIATMLSDSGFDIISEERKHNTDPALYADSVVQQIRRLLAGGVPAKNIAVLGDSKGALIAMLVSTRLENREIRYAVLGGCSTANLAAFPLTFHGNVLSIYEYGDTLGHSCASVFRRSKDMGNRKEIMIETGLGHSVFLHPLMAWLTPSIAWARAGH
jgi:hypothetical protein